MSQSYALLVRVSRQETRWRVVDLVPRALGLDWEVLAGVDAGTSCLAVAAWAVWAALCGMPSAFLAGRGVGLVLRLSAPYLLASAFTTRFEPGLPAAGVVGILAFFVASTPALQVLRCKHDAFRGLQDGVINDAFLGASRRASVWGAFMVGRRMLFAAVSPLPVGLVAPLVVQAMSLPLVLPYSYFHPILRATVVASEVLVTSAYALALAGYRGFGVGLVLAMTALVAGLVTRDRMTRDRDSVKPI